ncbi:MAG: DUF4259 domain-containing protein [Pyrinomonadaceae bacterium]
MGTWGTGIFDNDMACDWTYDLEDAEDLSLIKETIDAVFEEDYIDSDIASEALAAIEALARLKGRWGERNAYTETLDEWVEGHRELVIPESLPERSVRAIDAILGGESELKELWGESEEFEEWGQNVRELRNRIST